MRVWAFAAAVCVGCGFSGRNAPPPAELDAATEDAAIDVAIDAALPACASSALYGGAFGANRYRVLGDSVDYDTAIDRCAADGAHLAAVGDAPENGFLASLLSGDVWIGYDDLTNEGTFRWVTDASSTFTGFTGSEPNNSGNEDCTYLRPDGTWNDTSCDESRPAICECDLGHRQPATPACRTMPGSTVLLGRRYFLNKTGLLGWEAARQACAAIGAHLATISDAAEQDAIDFSYVGDSWIGYSDLAVEGTFAWVNGAPVDYTDWATGSPASATAGEEQDCVRLNLGWDDVPCAMPRQYTCECDPNPR